jgi:hypothetical protein
VDEALATLDRTEQAAVVLRFFADKKLAEVGQALGLTEEAARKRVTRGLDKLRSFFSRRGVQVSSSALAAALTAQAVQAAPAGLAASLAATSLAGGAAAASTGLSSALIHTLFMTKTTMAVVGIIAVGAVLAPVVLKKKGREPVAVAAVTSSEPLGTIAAPSSASIPANSVNSPANAPQPSTLLARVAGLAPLTAQQIGDYVTRNKGSAESLLAAWRAGGDKAWLTEAASKFPNNPEVQYAVIATQLSPETQRQWIEAYKASSPENALAWYFSAQEHLKAGDKAAAVAELSEASRKTAFRGELTATLQALEELNLSGGRASDEARIAAFQTCAQSPEIPGLRELAKGMRELIPQYRQQGDAASADSLAGSGLVLGAHLSDGYGSQTVINQLVGIGIQKTFLQMLAPGAERDPYGRLVAEVTANINQRQAALKEYAGIMQTLLAQLSDSEWNIYMERVKVNGEEAALAWLKARHQN